MELTDAERAAMLAIRENAFGDVYRIDGVRPPGSKDKVGAWRTRMQSLQDAWLAIDFDTQQTILSELAARHADPDSPIADLADVVTSVLRDAVRPSGAPPKHPGFGEVAMFLWRIWCRERPGMVSVDDEARQEIGAIIGELYSLDSTTAGRRVQNYINRRYQTHGDVPGRL